MKSKQRHRRGPVVVRGIKVLAGHWSKARSREDEEPNYNQRCGGGRRLIRKPLGGT